MRIAIIGAGFTGLSAAYYLSKSGHDVKVFEKDSLPGGLAMGFREPKWKWPLEKHYHHWFTNDKSAFDLAKEIGHEIVTKRPETSVYLEKGIFQLDSPINVLTFPKLTLSERLRMATVLAFIRYFPFWKILEGLKASLFLRMSMGKNAYEKLWEPLLKGKFEKYADDISLAWFWARITKRTPSLSYPKGGFLEFANTLVRKTKEFRGEYSFNTKVTQITESSNGSIKIHAVKNEKKLNEDFDKVLATIPSFSLLRIAKFSKEYETKLKTLKEISAINLILRLNSQFLKDGTYWLNVCDKNFPFIAIVEHTNYMESENYNSEHIVYVGKYLPYTHQYINMAAEELLRVYDPYLKQINPNYKSSLISYDLFKDHFAQPIITTNYSKIIPPLRTPIKNLYLANMQQIYPWDRGTNYAIELGEKIAKLITSHNE